MINTATIMGRLTRDPSSGTAGETETSKFCVAVDDRFKRDKTHFIDCEAFGSTARFVNQYFHKGQMIAVTGSLDYQTWTGRDGTNKNKLVVHADNVSFCGSKSETQTTRPERTDPPIVVDDDDDLPF